MKKYFLWWSVALAVLLFIVFSLLQRKFATQDIPEYTEEQVTVSEQVPVVPTPAPAEADEKITLPQKPAFDIVRVEEDGSMVAAGRAEPETELALMDGDEVLSSFKADERGEWVYIPSKPLPFGAHEMWLRGPSMNTQEESEVVVVNVPETKNKQDTIAVLLSSDSEDITVLQEPSADVLEQLEIKSADYVNKTFTVRGSVSETGRINVYADNVFLGAAEAQKPGKWHFKTVREMKTGKTYSIRADKTDAKGRVTARVEVPFTIESGMDAKKMRRIRIIKGDNLWTIAKHVYGSGFAYVTIYKANKRQIKNPDLIYPNQVFVLPKKAEK